MGELKNKAIKILEYLSKVKEKKCIKILEIFLKDKDRKLLGIDRYEKGDKYWESLHATLDFLNIDKKYRYTSKFLFNKFPNKKENTITRLRKLHDKKYIYCHIPNFENEKEIESISVISLGKEFIQNYKIEKNNNRKKFFIKSIVVPIVIAILTKSILWIIKNILTTKK